MTLMQCIMPASYAPKPTTSSNLLLATSPKQPTQEQTLTYETFPESILQRIGAQLSPIDRMCLQSACRRFRDVYAEWGDVEAVDIRCEDYGLYAGESAAISRIGFQFVKKEVRVSYHVNLTTRNGQTHRLSTTPSRNAITPLRTMLTRLTALKELIVWDACLPSELAGLVAKMNSLEVLRLWNCSRYLGKAKQSSKIISALLSRPSLKTLLILDSTASACQPSTCKAFFSRSLAQKIRGPIENLQLTGVHLPLSGMEAISERLAATCMRLSIGCTFGKEAKRLHYLRALMDMKLVTDLDLPPFIFHLDEVPFPDAVVQRLFEALPLRALGFRHYNSSVLFRFIEHHLPHKIRLLRVHHNSNRVPNFAQLGQESAAEMPKKKSSVTSRYSILSASRSSIGSMEGSSPSSSGYGSWARSDSVCSSSATMTTSEQTTNRERKNSTSLASYTLATRRLTIFAVTEERSNRRKQRLRKRNYSGVDVIYTQETIASQEILGSMASPMQSPHVYSKNVVRRADNRIRVIKGDLVKPIPLSSLGMESDYELSDWED
ncbi:hypothetical protein AAVH_28809 [Aphelenchoides avenae]|nr:hypothetical protein AAVH_28809 [Aphelenchus avenae]